MDDFARQVSAVPGASSIICRSPAGNTEKSIFSWNNL